MQGQAVWMLRNIGLPLVISGSLIATMLSHQNTGFSQLRHAIRGFLANDADTKSGRCFLAGKNPRQTSARG